MTSFSSEQLNFFKFSTVVLDEFPVALRKVFVHMWDTLVVPKYGCKKWDDSAAVLNWFLSKEGGATKVPTLNKPLKDWDCTALFKATLFSQSFAMPDGSGRLTSPDKLYVKPRGLISGAFHHCVLSPSGDQAETFALALDQLRLLRNTLCHQSSTRKLDKITFDQYLLLAKNAFYALRQATTKIDYVGNLGEDDFPTAKCQRLKDELKREKDAAIKFKQIEDHLSQIKSGVKDVASDVKDVKMGLTDVGSDVKDVKTGLTDVGSDVKDVKTGLTDVASDVEDVKTGLTDVGTDVKDVKTGLTDVASDVKDVKTRLTDVGSDVKDVKTGLTDVASDVEDVKTSLTDVGSDVKDVKTGLTDVGSDVKDVKTGLTDVASDVEDVKTGLTDVASDVEDVKTGLTDVETDVKDVKTGLTVVGSDVKEIKADLRNIKQVTQTEGCPKGKLIVTQSRSS